MTYSVSEKQALWQKVGDRDVKIAEFKNSMIISGEFALLFDELDEKKLKIIREFLDIWEKHTPSPSKEIVESMIETQNREPNKIELGLAEDIIKMRGRKPKKEADVG